MNNQGLSVPIAMLITNRLMKKYSLSNDQYTIIYPAITICVNKAIEASQTLDANLIKINENDLMFYGIPLLLIVLSYYAYNYYVNSRKSSDNTTRFTVYGKSNVNAFLEYTHKYSEYFDHNCDHRYGDPNKDSLDIMIGLTGAGFRSTTDSNYPDAGTKVHFNDKQFNVKGYYLLHFIEKTITIKEKNTNINTLSLEIVYEGKQNPVKLWKKMMEVRLDDGPKLIRLKYRKCFIEGAVLTPVSTGFYNGESKPFEENIKNMDDYFHQQKPFILNLIHNLHNKNIPRISLLLHGPPGTGKSSLVYHLARCLERSIMSIDLKSLSKKSAYKLLLNPSIYNSNMHFYGEYDDHIYVFEEFDISIMELYSREKIYKASEEKIFENLTDISNLSSLDELKLRDLLELFQGPIPMQGQIIIATTNKFQLIKEMCPELFRPGRITPVLIDYLNMASLQELSQHYFKKELTLNKQTINIPTSQITDLAMRNKGDFDAFQAKLLEALN